MLKCTIAGGRTKGANEESFVFVHQRGGYDVRENHIFPKISCHIASVVMLLLKVVSPTVTSQACWVDLQTSDSRFANF